MTVRIYPAGSREAYRLCAAIDAELGYPRTHTEDEVVRRGRGPHAPIESIRTETYTRPLVHADGRTAIEIDDTIRALAGREVEVTDGARVRVRIDATPTAERLPGDREEWAPAEPRGGIEPSARVREDAPRDRGRA